MEKHSNNLIALMDNPEIGKQKHIRINNDQRMVQAKTQDHKEKLNPE